MLVHPYRIAPTLNPCLEILVCLFLQARPFDSLESLGLLLAALVDARQDLGSVRPAHGFVERKRSADELRCRGRVDRQSLGEDGAQGEIQRVGVVDG